MIKYAIHNWGRVSSKEIEEKTGFKHVDQLSHGEHEASSEDELWSIVKNVYNAGFVVKVQPGDMNTIVFIMSHWPQGRS